MDSYKIFDSESLAGYVEKESLSTPCYIYDGELLNNTFAQAKASLGRYFDNAYIHYAVKANHNPKIIDFVKKHDVGIDCVSGGEIKRVLEQGINPKHIVFAGVGKADWEIELAIDANIFAFNCESIQEIGIINQIAKSKNRVVNVCLRVNPDIDAQTHHYISTGQFDDKFGIAFSNVCEFMIGSSAKLSNISVIGLHYHVGSQVLNLKVFKDLVSTANEHLEKLKTLGYKVKHLNLGGGLGIDYQNPELNPIVDFDNFFALIAEGFQFKDKVVLHFELGRSLVAQSGILLSKVLFTKTTQNTNFAIIDAGMTELIRPALYQAKHKIVAIDSNGTMSKYHIVGPICESSDIFAKHYFLPSLKRGDLVAIYSAGAYGKVLASEYNLRPIVQEYFI